MSLTDSKCKAVKAKSKPIKISDSGGLYLHVQPSGLKVWRYKYRYLGKEKVLTIGQYRQISLSEARFEREKAKLQLSKMIDPCGEKKALYINLRLQAENTFGDVALEWFEVKNGEWTEDYRANIMRRLEMNLFPDLKDVPIKKLSAPYLLEVLRKVEKRGAIEIASRCRQTCGAIFRYAVQVGKADYNPIPDLQGALKTRKVQHFAAIETSEIPRLIKAINNNDVRLFCRTRRAIKLSMLTFVRPGELRKAEWSEIDFEKKLWSIPGAKMKMDKPHIVPLSSQALEILNIQKGETGHLKTPYVFPNQWRIFQPMSDGAVRVALQNLGFKGQMTAHGFRALARSSIREELDYEPDIIEVQLAHKPKGSLGAAYDRSKFLKQRTKMMQEWADYLDKV